MEVIDRPRPVLGAVRTRSRRILNASFSSALSSKNRPKPRDSEPRRRSDAMMPAQKWDEKPGGSAERSHKNRRKLTKSEVVFAGVEHRLHLRGDRRCRVVFLEEI